MGHELTTEDRARFEGWAQQRAVVMYLPALVVGRVEHFFTGGPGDRHLSRVQNGPQVIESEVEAPVLLLHNGHSFVADPRSFAELSGEQAEQYGELAERISDALVLASVRLRMRGLDAKPRDWAVFTVAALRAQLAAAEAAQQGLAQQGEPS